MEICKVLPRCFTVLIAKLLRKLMRIDYRYDIILFNELNTFIKYNTKDEKGGYKSKIR